MSTHTPRPTEQLRDMIQSKDLSFIMEAHNGLSAKIVKEAGFKGIWGSGLSISAAMGVRDANEASWTQVLEVLDHMVDASGLQEMMVTIMEKKEEEMENERRWRAKAAERAARGESW